MNLASGKKARYPAEGATSQQTVWYRCDRKFFWTGVICTVLFFLMGVFSVVTALWNPDSSFKRPVLTAIAVASFWLGFTVLGVWLVWFAVKAQLGLSEEQVQQF